MSNDLAMTMDELELESAELLPSRETLCVARWHSHSHGSYNNNSNNHYNYTSTDITQADGNTSQFGLLNISALNGNLNSLL